MKNKKSRNFRRLRYGTASTVMTAVVIVVILLLNILVSGLADRFPLTWDLSSDKVFTLSEESVQIAESVKNEVEIVVFTDEEFFSNPTAGSISGVPEDATAMREFLSALQQYRSHSGNKISFQFINPNQDPTAFAKYEKYDVEAYDILFLSGERYKTSTVTDLCTSYEDIYNEYYSSGTYTFSSFVEKVVGANINALQSANDRIVQVLVGHEEDEYTLEGLKTLYELNGYTFEELNITGSSAFNEKAEVMLIPAPNKDYSDAEIKRVREWVTNGQKYGRHLIVFTDYDASCPNLYGMLETEYKIKVTDQLLTETDYDRVQQYLSYFPVCDVPVTDYTAHSAGTGNVFTPLARRLTTTLEAELSQENAIGDTGVMLTNYPESAQVISLKDFSNQESGSAVTLEEEEYPLTSMIAAILTRYDNNTGTAADGSVIVSGCQTMAYSEYIQNSTLMNEELLLDAINSVTGNEDTLTISSKEITADTTTFSTTTQLVLGLGVFTVGVPVLVLVICLIVFLRRKNL